MIYELSNPSHRDHLGNPILCLIVSGIRSSIDVYSMTNRAKSIINKVMLSFSFQ